MRMSLRAAAACATFGLLVAASPASAQGGRGVPPDSGQAFVEVPVPTDLKPLLAPRHSEMRLVIARYAADRALISANYAGAAGGRGGGGAPGAGGRGRGRGGAAADTIAPVPVSRARLSRLKRFDLDWE